MVGVETDNDPSPRLRVGCAAGRRSPGALAEGEVYLITAGLEPATGETGLCRLGWLGVRVVVGCRASSPETSASWLLSIGDWLLLSEDGFRRAKKLPAGCSILERLRLEEKVVMALSPYLVDSEMEDPISMAEPERREMREEGSEGLRKLNEDFRGDKILDQPTLKLRLGEAGAKGEAVDSPRTTPEMSSLSLRGRVPTTAAILSLNWTSPLLNNLSQAPVRLLRFTRNDKSSMVAMMVFLIGDKSGRLILGRASLGKLKSGIETEGKLMSGKASLGSWMSGREKDGILMSKAKESNDKSRSNDLMPKAKV